MQPREAPSPSLLGALHAGAVAVSRRAGARRLLEDCWTPIRNAAELRFADILLETLGPLAKSEDEAEAAPAKQVLLRDKAALQAFSDALSAEFKSAVDAFCTHRSQEKNVGATGLSLVEYEDMEFATLMERASARIRNAVDSEFNALKVRLANLVREPEVRDAENPFRPVIFLRAIYLGLERVGVCEPDLLRLTKRFDAALVEPIAAAYAAVDRHLETQGIGAEITPITLNRNSGNTTSGTPATPFTNSVMRSLHAEGGNTSAGPTSLPGIAGAHASPFGHGVAVDQLLHALYQRMHLVAAPAMMPGVQPVAPQIAPASPMQAGAAVAPLLPAGAVAWPQGPVGVGAAGAGTLVDAELLAALAEAQRLGAGLAPGTPSAPVIAPVVDASVLRTQVVDKAARRVDKLTIEIVGLVFERIEQDRLVPAPIKEQLQRLQFPLIRMALLDPDLFVSPQQPARQLLDRIAATSVGWVAHGEENQRYLEEVRQAVESVLASAEEGATPFQQALERFEKYLLEVNTRHDDPVARAKRALEDAETREVLAINATIQVRKAFEGVMVESYLRDFLLDTWVRVLVAANLREAEQPGLMRHFLKLVPALVWTVQPKVDPEEKQHLARKVPAVLKALREGLALIDWPQAKAQAFFAQLLNSHAQAIKALELAQGANGEFSTSTMRIKLEGIVMDAERLPEDIAGSELPVSDDAVEQVLNANKVDVAHVRADDTPEATEDADLERRMAAFRRGDWFDLRNDTGIDRVQLRWLSPRRAIYLFATARDDKIFSMKPATLRALMRDGRVTPVEDRQIFDRALQATMAALEQAAAEAPVAA